MPAKKFFVNNLSHEIWTLFLDRDGVINQRLHEDYVKSWSEFKFIPGVKDALSVFSPLFRYIFVVTNQQGIGKGLMTEEALSLLHSKMLEDIVSYGGRIDKVYHCPDLEGSGSTYRKPNIGMALKVKKEFPEVNFRRSVMAGDSVSDMKFGRKAGMITVFISDDLPVIRQHHSLIDFAFPDLLTFANSLHT
ncbi:MAG: D-glycero-alpha-D-manno-heptose-1,7-bisphosphate 7-phosphatase [Bacteroidales bacterium]